MRAAVGKENVTVFFIFIFLDWRNYVILKVKRRRHVRPDRWTGPGTSHGRTSVCQHYR
jgi:hypothetical protein